MLPRSTLPKQFGLARLSAPSSASASRAFSLVTAHARTPHIRQALCKQSSLVRLYQRGPAFSTALSLAKEKNNKNKDADPKGFFDSSVDNVSADPETTPNPAAKKTEPTSGSAAASVSPAEAEKSSDDVADTKEAKQSSKSSSGSKDAKDARGSAASGSSSGDGSGSGNGGGKKGPRSGERSLQKPEVPEDYPQVLALPISRRPLFPGFYKAITVKDPHVAAAITESIKRGQPYIGTFMFKDEHNDEDVIRNIDDVHDVGVFAQITSAFPIHGQEGGLTAILYPHRRIKLSSLIPPGAIDPKKPSPSDKEASSVEPEPIPKSEPEEPKGDVVASFEESALSPTTATKADPKYEPTSFLRKYPVSLVNVENLTDDPYDPKSPFIRAVTNEIVNVFKEVASMNNLFRDQISTFSMSQTGNVTSDPAKLADFAAAVASGEASELQEILTSMNVEERMQKALTVLKKELMNAQLQSKISKDVENKISRRQREYWLMEQMKGIRRELGLESDGKEKLVEKFKEKADKLAMPEAVRKVFDDEIHKLAHLETAASEFNVTRNYLDWLTQIPWGIRSTENFGIDHAMSVLNEDHYGLKDVKDRILEFIAVGKLRGTVEGKILCFVGPPGVGKTSIGKSIARALNREYYRFSVGGLTDVAEIKGHRRTYVGALPGRIIQALKKCQTENPLILIDEIDKIGRGYQGDPSSALLELLDPEQNSSFLDHYMDVPVDLSKVLFVCTANMTDTIPRPLLDRMELIQLSGYVADEKMAIAQKYLAPVAKEMAGLQNVNVDLAPDAVEELIKSYCRESGVRNLKKHIEKLYRKSALKIVQEYGEDIVETPTTVTETESEVKAKAKTDTKAEATDSSDVSSDSKGLNEATTASASKSLKEDESATSSTVKKPEEPRPKLILPDSVKVIIDKNSLADYVGPPVFTSDRLYEVNPAGVSMGLAWTQMGGAAMYVESILQQPLRHSSRPHLDITGNLKNVMKESSTIAYSFAKSFMAREFPDNDFFDKANLHLHVPDGAVPKDGPSAGITMATSLLSLALDTPVAPTVAMTGELTLTGKVLRIGGLREKTVAARRAGCTTILFPRDCMHDWLELPENIKEGIDGKPVAWYQDVFDIIFPSLDREAANKSRLPPAKEGKSSKGENEEGVEE
ncbi:Lon protease -like protein, mitochondrial [Ceratocystis fimbriata CBS 114723]|uniref:Lon protease homolog, mitochondrial n=1 Tax=Ceratocystis fimbriata CBS 114723 TaxID=1035309 RepID=A0A2C5XAF9_9PEZI|nr:Lon protease -like protein, mitochondrial [Ceratocystis fimbriata CBS 114723]